MLKTGQKVKFTYLKQFKEERKAGEVLTDYTDQSEVYFGEIVDVRNIVESPVSQETIRRDNIKGRRSEMLYTVELAGGDVKTFYDGRMVGTEVLPDAKRDLFQTLASAIFGDKAQAVS
jgi:cytidylate kinase